MKQNYNSIGMVRHSTTLTWATRSIIAEANNILANFYTLGLKEFLSVQHFQEQCAWDHIVNLVLGKSMANHKELNTNLIQILWISFLIQCYFVHFPTAVFVRLFPCLSLSCTLYGRYKTCTLVGKSCMCDMVVSQQQKIPPWIQQCCDKLVSH